MDETETGRLNQLNDDIATAINEVDGALESGEEPRQIAAGKLVEALAARWRELTSALSPADQEHAERGVGRRLTDLRRAAAALSRRDSGQRVQSADDAGAVPFIERRAPPKSIVPQRAAPSSKMSVGGEVDSWCGKCKEMTTHNIVAMVGDHAKQVICQVCNSRHDFRTEPPARHKKAAGAVTTTGSSSSGDFPSAARRNEDRELQRRQEAKRLLQKELADAVEPRTFDPKGALQGGRDHRPPRAWTRQDRERAARLFAGPLPRRVASARPVVVAGDRDPHRTERRKDLRRARRARRRVVRRRRARPRRHRRAQRRRQVDAAQAARRRRRAGRRADHAAARADPRVRVAGAGARRRPHGR